MLTKIQSLCKLESAGKELFSQSMEDFKMICAGLTTSVFRRAAAEARAGSESGSEAEVDKAADQLNIDAFLAKQQAHWSDTPARDRDAIDFMTETIPIIGKSASKIMNLRTAVPKGYSTEVKVQEAIESVQSLEASKPHLQFMLGDDLAERFVGAVKKMSGILKPIHEEIVKTAVRKATANIKKLQDLVIDEATPLDNDTFYKKCFDANVEAIRIERSLAKSKFDALRTCRAELPEELKLADSLVAQARCQMIRFEVLAVLRRPDLSQPTDKGADLREQLKSIWTLHPEDQDVMAYLGTELVGEGPGGFARSRRRGRGSWSEAGRLCSHPHHQEASALIACRWSLLRSGRLFGCSAMPGMTHGGRRGNRVRTPCACTAAAIMRHAVSPPRAVTKYIYRHRAAPAQMVHIDL